MPVPWRWAGSPECGFLNYGWQGYNEALVLYVLGLGSRTHPLTAASFQAWTLTYQWENLYDIDLLVAGPLFMHEFSHAWLDLRGIRDRFMREKGSDYFENSRRATQVQRQYAIRNPRGFEGYGQDCWGLSAGDGPSVEPQAVTGRQQTFYGYAARGVPWGPDDGTITGSSVVASLVFAPDIALPALRLMYGQTAGGRGRAVHASGFNATAGGGGGCWRRRGLDVRGRVRTGPGHDRPDDRELPLGPAVAADARHVLRARRPQACRLSRWLALGRSRRPCR